jgi:hypothetical protein
MDNFAFPQEVESGLGIGTGIEGNLTQDYAAIFRGGLRAIQEALNKSMVAGYEVNLPDMSGGGALRLESLEADLKKLIVDEQSTALFNDLLASKRPAASTIEQFTTIDSIGEAETYLEAEAPGEIDHGLTRHTVQVKYIGAVGKVSNVAATVKTQTDPVSLVKRLNNLAIKVKANKVSYNGNSSFVASEFDGLYYSVKKSAYASTNIIDLGGHQATIEDFNKAINAISQQKGYVTSAVRAYMSPSAKMGYKAELLKDKFYIVGGAASGMRSSRAEAALDSFGKNMIAYDEGEMPMKKDIFLEPRFTPGNSTIYPLVDSVGTAFVGIGATPPSAPVIAAATPTGDSTSGLTTGDYKYAVRAVNKYGHKSAAVESGTVHVGSNENVTFTITEGGSSPAARVATAYEFYRKPLTPTTGLSGYQYIFTKTVAEAKVDNNTYLPNTSRIYIVDFDMNEVLQYAQLLDFALFPLATSVDATTWLQRLYGVLMIYNAQRIAILENVGTTQST